MLSTIPASPFPLLPTPAPASAPGALRVAATVVVILVVALLGLGLWSTPATAAEDDLDPRRWTVEDLITAEDAGDWRVAADGSFAVWVKEAVESVGGEERTVDNLWWSSLRPGSEEEAAARPLTRGAQRIRGVELSPDDRRVAFLTDRDLPGDAGKGDPEPAGRQIWLLPLTGGEAWPVSRFAGAIRGFDWIDADTLVVAAEEAPSARLRQREEGDDTSEVVEEAEHTPPVRLFRLHLRQAGPARTERLGDEELWASLPEDDWIRALAVSPDGRRAVISVAESLSWQFDQKVPPATYLVDLASGERTLLELTGEGPDGAPRQLLPNDVRWQPDGAGFFFVDEYTNHPVYRMATIPHLYHLDLASGEPRRVPLDWPRGLRDYVPTPDGFLALLMDGVTLQAARYVRDGHNWRRSDLQPPPEHPGHAGRIEGLWLSRNGETVVYQHSSATVPTQYWTARLEGSRLLDARPVTDLNADFAGKPTGRVETVHFEGARGDTVEGLLFYPLDWEEGERRPLILDIHGGPTGVDRDSWSQHWASPGILWRQQGAFVLQVNYHGSTGYGLEWAESIRERYYELEIPDLEAGVDHVLSLGLADPERLATFGWSNGGILSAELITRTDRYRAASIGAADVEWLSDWANVDFGASFDNYYFGGPPWEIPQVYLDKSPFLRLTEVETPTLVHTGTEDRAVPPHQSWSLFRALQQIGKVPVRLVLYPGEPHSLREIPHRRRKLLEDLAWFDEHLFGEAAGPHGDRRGVRGHEVVAEGSPLAALLARARAARTGGVFGREEAGVLVPETVPAPILAGDDGEGDARAPHVGRFEVTRAQWQAYRDAIGSGASLSPEQADLPATGMTVDEARAYAAWLSERTGRAWRLPTEEEGKKLAGAAGKGGNTLDRWAGYTPNPEDRRRLLERVHGTAGTGALLLPVGRFPGAGEGGAMVFDLDGNAAEWAERSGDEEGDGKGEGVAVGPSADRPRDSAGTPAPAAEYIGLRLVVDP